MLLLSGCSACKIFIGILIFFFFSKHLQLYLHSDKIQWWWHLNLPSFCLWASAILVFSALFSVTISNAIWNWHRSIICKVFTKHIFWVLVLDKVIITFFRIRVVGLGLAQDQNLTSEVINSWLQCEKNSDCGSKEARKWGAGICHKSCWMVGRIGCWWMCVQWTA